MEEARGAAALAPSRAWAVGEAAFAAVVAVALFVAGATLKGPFSPAALLCPVPLVLVAIRQGSRVAIPSVALAAGVVGAAQMPGASALAFVLVVGLPALVLGLCLRRNASLERAVLLAAATLCAAFVVDLGIRAGGLHGIAPAYREVGAELDRDLHEAQVLFEGLGAPGDVAGAAAVMPVVRAFARTALPGLLAAGNLLSAAAIAVLAMALAGRTVGTGTPAFSWALPEGLVWAFIAAGAATLIPWGPWRLVGLNALPAILALYLLQGLSIAGFFCRRLGLPWYLRALALLLALIWPPLTLMVVAATIALGLFDVWVAFRRLDTPHSSGTAR